MSPHHLVPSIPVDSKCVLSCVLISHTLRSLFLDFSLRSIDLFAHVSCPPPVLYTSVMCPTWGGNHHSPSSSSSSFLIFSGLALSLQDEF